MKRWWQTLNTVDRLYFGWFTGLAVTIALQRHHVPGWTGFLALHCGLLMIIGLLAWGAAGDRYANFFHDWYPLAVFIVAFEEVARLSFLFVPHWQDSYVLRWEAALFPEPPTVWLARHASPLLTELLNVGYFGYFVLLMIVGGALYCWRDKRPFRQVMTASVLSYMACYVVFLVFPTEGPAHTLSVFHQTNLHGGPFYWAVLLIQKFAGVHGNAFPSSHVAAGLIALIFAWRYLPKLGAALTPIVVLLCAGAVYDRYHYALDVLGGLVVGAAVSGAVLCARWVSQSTRVERNSHVEAANLHSADVRGD